jgi:hypothetical protein
MKSTFFKSFAVAAAIIASFSAQAADQTYKSTDGQAFGLHNVYRVDGAVAGVYVRVVYANGGDNLYFDQGGAVYNKIIANNPQLVAVSGANSYVDPTYAARIVCQSGVSKIAIQGSSAIVEAADSCTMANQAIAKAK